MNGNLEPEESVMSDNVISSRKAIAVCNQELFRNFMM